MVFQNLDLSHLSNHRQENPLCRLKIFLFFLGIFLVSLFPHSYVEGLDISDTPLEVKILSAPPNIMFVLDNSGSMDWEFMTDDVNGKFAGNIEYLFDAGE